MQDVRRLDEPVDFGSRVLKHVKHFRAALLVRMGSQHRPGVREYGRELLDD
jgi:hypothetical protein